MHKYVDDCIAALILIMLFVLLLTGIDGEVKTLFAGTIGVIIRGVYERVKHKRG